MDDLSYTELKNITDKYYSGNNNLNPTEILNLLAIYSIKTRTKDGKLDTITVSIPKSVPNGIVVGLRYTKKDNTKTEDLFLFQENKPLETGYKGVLEKKLKEYKGMHKAQR